MAGSIILRCLRPAAEARIVDRGRPGHRARGIPTGGPADPRAHRAANRLLSQPMESPCLELALTGGRWQLSGRGQLVLTGADLQPRLDGEPVELYRVTYLDGDHLLTTGAAQNGCRTYLGLRGNWQLPALLGSGEAGLPGIPPVLPGWSVTVSWEQAAPFAIDLDGEATSPPHPLSLEVVGGPEWERLPGSVREWLMSTPFTIGRNSNRQGLRLESMLSPPSPNFPMLSTPVLPGTVQLSPSGPLLLGPDAQTLGGYPRALLLARPEQLAQAYQLRPGQTLRFSLQAR